MADILAAAAQLGDLTAWLPLLATLLFKGSLLLVLAEVVRLTLKRRSASSQYWMGAIAVFSLLVLPVLSTLIPSWDVPILSDKPVFLRDLSEAASFSTLTDSRSTRHRNSVGPATDDSPEPSRRSVTVTPQPPIARDPDLALQRSRQQSPVQLDNQTGRTRAGVAVPWLTVAIAVWLVGLVVLSTRLVLAMACVWWIARQAVVPIDRRLDRSLESLCRKMGMRRRVRLLLSDRLEVALTLGFWRPAVILPTDAGRWSRGRLRSILLHELAHAKRWDNVLNIASQIACAIYWFHPLAWRLCRRLTVDRERSCDDAVIESGTKPSDYASHLLEVAGALFPGRRLMWRPIEVSQRSALKSRLEAILDPTRERRAVGTRGLIGAIVAGSLLVPLAAVRPWVEFGGQKPEGQTLERSVAKKRVGRSSATPIQSSPLIEIPEASGGNSARRQSPVSARISRAVGILAGQTDLGLRAAALRRTQTSRTTTAEEPGLARELANLILTPLSVTPTGLPFAGSYSSPRPAGPRDAPAEVPTDVESIDDSGAERRIEPDAQEEETPRDEPTVEDALPVRLLRVDMGTLGGGESRATAVNSKGEAAGSSATAHGDFHAFFWSSTTGMLDIGVLGEEDSTDCLSDCRQGAFAQALDINDRGDVVGFSTNGSGRTRGFVWTKTEGLLDLGTLGGDYSVGLAVNSLGEVIGTSRNREGKLRAFHWTRRAGMIDLGGPEQFESEAVAINDSGEVVGTIHGHAFVWTPDAGMYRLGPDDIFSEATGINNRGFIIGHASFDRGFVKAFLWDPEGGMVNLGTLGPDFQASTAIDINEKGDIVGRSTAIRNPFMGEVEVRTVVWTPDFGALDVDAFGSGDANFIPELGLNNRGQMVGRRPDDPGSGSVRGFLWSLSEGTTELGDPDEEFDVSWPIGVNDAGEIVGTASLPNGEGGELFQAVLWKLAASRRPSDLAEPSHGPGEAEAEPTVERVRRNR